MVSFLKVTILGVLINAILMMITPFAAAEKKPGPGKYETEEYMANWGLDAIHASIAYAAGWTGAGMLIGVIDSGYDINHIDLATQIVYIDDPSLPPRDHGTYVAGIAAAAKNQIGMHGVAYDARLAVSHLGASIQSMADSFQLFRQNAPGRHQQQLGPGFKHQ